MYSSKNKDIYTVFFEDTRSARRAGARRAIAWEKRAPRICMKILALFWDLGLN
jgi:hypothetical protein